MSGKKGYIIFGAGYEGRNILKALGRDRVCYFCDNSQSGEVLGVQVIDFATLREVHMDYDVILGVQKKTAIEQISE